MPSLDLTPAQRRRIEKLAELAGRTPQSMLRFVLRDGLEATEQDVRETIEADEDIDRNGGIPHGKVMAEARASIEFRAGAVRSYRQTQHWRALTGSAVYHSQFNFMGNQS